MHVAVLELDRLPKIELLSWSWSHLKVAKDRDCFDQSAQVQG